MAFTIHNGILKKMDEKFSTLSLNYKDSGNYVQ